MDMKLQLELNEQEIKILREKVDKLNAEKDKLQRELSSSTDSKSAASLGKRIKQSIMAASGGDTNVDVNSLKEEMAELRRKLIEKDRELENVQTELSVRSKKGGGKGLPSRSKYASLLACTCYISIKFSNFFAGTQQGNSYGFGEGFYGFGL